MKELARLQDARAKVGLATRQSAEGMRIFAVAADSDQKVDDKITRKMRRGVSIRVRSELKHRDNTPVVNRTAAAAAILNCSRASHASARFRSRRNSLHGFVPNL